MTSPASQRMTFAEHRHSASPLILPSLASRATALLHGDDQYLNRQESVICMLNSDTEVHLSQPERRRSLLEPYTMMCCMWAAASACTCDCTAYQPRPGSRVSRVLNVTAAPLPGQAPGTCFGTLMSLLQDPAHTSPLQH